MVVPTGDENYISGEACLCSFFCQSYSRRSCRLGLCAWCLLPIVLRDALLKTSLDSPRFSAPVFARSRSRFRFRPGPARLGFCCLRRFSPGWSIFFFDTGPNQPSPPSMGHRRIFHLESVLYDTVLCGTVSSISMVCRQLLRSSSLLQVVRLGLLTASSRTLLAALAWQGDCWYDIIERIPPTRLCAAGGHTLF